MLTHVLAWGSLSLVVVGLLLAGLGMPIPEDPLLLASGVLAHRTPHPWWLVFVLVYASSIAADCGVFILARRFGDSALERRPLRWMLTEGRRQRVSSLFSHHGAKAILLGRHILGLRAVIFAFAGLEKMRLWRFIVWDSVAALATIPALFGLGYFFSTHVDAVRAGAAHFEHWLAAVAAVAGIAGWWLWSRRHRE